MSNALTNNFIWLPIIQGSIPITPVAKARPRKGKNGMYTPSKTKKAEDVIGLYLKRSALEAPISDAVGVKLDFVSPRPKAFKGDSCRALRPKKPDIDNLCKLFLDGINGIVIVDDAQVVYTQCTDWYAAKDEDAKIEFAILKPFDRTKGMLAILDQALTKRSIYALADELGISWRTLHRYKSNPNDDSISDKMKLWIENLLEEMDITIPMF